MSRASREGFTLIEMLVASFVVSLLLIGVYAVLRQGVELEQRYTAGWRERTAADAIARLIARDFERALIVGETATIVAFGSDTSTTLTMTLSAGHEGARGAGPIEVRYQWTSSDRKVVRRWRPMAGSRDIGLPRADADSRSETRWRGTPGEVIGDGVQLLQIELRERQPASSAWLRRWDGPADALVRVLVRVGDTTATRISSTHVQASVIGSEPRP